jgi:protein-S-isoprenylcysteine O-methyltransferase Ste14
MDVITRSRTAILVVTVAVLYLFLRHALFANRPVFVFAQVVAAALMLWARLTFGLRSFHGAANATAGGVQTRGPYRWIRHPIYAAILLFVWSGVSAHPSLGSIGAGAIASVGTAVRIVAEERLVLAQYPEYAEYAARTKRLIPYIF